MKILNSLSTAFLLIFLSSFQKSDPIKINEVPVRGFMSNKPAESWEEALVTGNGTMGAMIMGNPYSETIIVNHALLYLPVNKPLKPVSQGVHLQEIRDMMLKGDYGKASKFVVELSQQEGYDKKRWTDPYIPAFDLKIEMQKGSVLNYARTVNFETGEAEVKWKDSKGVYSRSTFVSRKDNIIVTRIKANGTLINCNVNIKQRLEDTWWAGVDVRKNSGIDDLSIVATNNSIFYRTSFLNQWDNFIKGYEGVVYVVNKGGKLIKQGQSIDVSGASELIILTRVEPSYDYSVSHLKNILSALKKSQSYSDLLKVHTALHSKIFNRVKLDLGGDIKKKKQPIESLLSEELLRPDPALIEMEFDAARYNLISSTGINPPNFQGIWSGTVTPPWSSDFTTNGNLPVVVSSMLSCNMPELMLPLFDLLERNMNDFEINAKELFNCRGIHVPSRMSSHGLNNHFDATWPMTFWTAGAGWYSMFYFDYYIYTGDVNFLRKRALPFMEKATLFYEDFLTLGKDGKYIFNPSYSPENNPLNIPDQGCINATMDVMVASQLIRNTIRASEILGVNKDKIGKWKSMLEKMPPYEVNANGELREWMWPGAEENPAHRHVSQLYALFDIMDPAFKNNRELINAAEKVINEKMEVRRKDRGGVMAFGMVQLAFASAMLGDTNNCYDILGWLTKNYWRNNMMTAHDPGTIFNMDLSGGYPAVISKMLLYSEPGLLSLLPALPKELSSGSIEGFLARGGIKIEKLDWEKNKIKAEISSSSDQKNLIVQLPGEVISFKCEGADATRTNDLNQLHLNLKANHKVGLELTLKR